MFSKTLALFGLASAASAHIIMTNPVPLGNPSNSPLDASGSDFPCKGPVTGGNGGENTYAQGSTQKLAFKGTAVHGGGSCQVSVTTDLNPTTDSVWKVIKSIEGGCPAQGQAGNIGDDANAPVPYTYDFTIPQDLATGEYVFAWTWFNKVGNREMYMNCAAVTITGSGGSEGFLDTLPDMFVANIGNGCGTVSDADVEFPNPGNELEQLNGATSAFAAPSGNCMGSPGNPSPPAPTENPGAPSPVPSPTSSPVATPMPTASVPGGVFMPIPSEEPSEPAPTQPATGGDSSPSDGYSAGTACSTEGSWNCVGDSSFQRCASGTWTALQALAPGMDCNSLQSKRTLRRAVPIQF